jgi:hypothetical protein
MINEAKQVQTPKTRESPHSDRVGMSGEVVRFVVMISIWVAHIATMDIMLTPDPSVGVIRLIQMDHSAVSVQSCASGTCRMGPP